MMEIDWGNSGFLRLYGLVFGLSTVLTMVMWLIAVVKRVVRGVPAGQAVMENVGYLMMSVAVAGFAPVAVAYTVDIVDSSANAILGDYIAELFTGGAVIFTLLTAITTIAPGVGVVIAIPIATMLLLAIFGLWVMLIVRNAMILMGLVFGPLVFSGLVDKDLWSHTRRWVGIMGGIVFSKLGIYLALALAGAIIDGTVGDVRKASLSQAIGGCITFLALIFMALFMPFQIAKWLPFVGDELQAMHGAKEAAGQKAQQAKAKQDDMKAQSANKSSPGSGGSSGPEGGSGGGGGEQAAGGAAGPAAAAMAVKQGLDNARDQTVQAAQEGANNGAGGGGQDSGGGSSEADGSGSKQGGPRGGGQGGGGAGGGGSGSARRPPPPPPRSGNRSGPPPPPSRPGGSSGPPAAPAAGPSGSQSAPAPAALPPIPPPGA